MTENQGRLVKKAVNYQAKPNPPAVSSRKPKAKSGKNKPKTRKLQRRISLLFLLDHHVEEMLLVGLVPEVEVLAPLVEEPPPLGNTESQPPLPLPLPNVPVGGRLAHFAQNWADITDDNWVLSLIRKGYRIPFKERPILSPDPTFFQQPLSLQLEEEVASLLSKGAVEEIIPECPGYYSRIFLVPKKNGKLRLIIDLSVLNHSVYTETFEMETQRKVRNAVQLNDWAFSLDLTDAYLHIYLDTSSVSQIPQIHVERSSVPVQGTPIRPLDKSFRVYTPYDCHSDIPKDKGYNSTSLSRRLVSSKPKPSKTVGTQTIHFVADQFTRSDNQLREIRPKFQLKCSLS